MAVAHFVLVKLRVGHVAVLREGFVESFAQSLVAVHAMELREWDDAQPALAVGAARGIALDLRLLKLLPFVELVGMEAPEPDQFDGTLVVAAHAVRRRGNLAAVPLDDGLGARAVDILLVEREALVDPVAPQARVVSRGALLRGEGFLGPAPREGERLVFGLPLLVRDALCLLGGHAQEDADLPMLPAEGVDGPLLAAGIPVGLADPVVEKLVDGRDLELLRARAGEAVDL